jgi:hypothetical protein
VGRDVLTSRRNTILQLCGGAASFGSSLKRGGVRSLCRGSEKSCDRFVVALRQLVDAIVGQNYENQRTKFQTNIEANLPPACATARSDARAQLDGI